jgi:hypothetical protein
LKAVELTNLVGRVILEKLTRLEPVKKLPEFYGTRRFFTVFTRTHHLSLSLTKSSSKVLPRFEAVYSIS